MSVTADASHARVAFREEEGKSIETGPEGEDETCARYTKRERPNTLLTTSHTEVEKKNPNFFFANFSLSH